MDRLDQGQFQTRHPALHKQRLFHATSARKMYLTVLISYEFGVLKKILPALKITQKLRPDEKSIWADFVIFHIFKAIFFFLKARGKMNKNSFKQNQNLQNDVR